MIEIQSKYIYTHTQTHVYMNATRKTITDSPQPRTS